MENADLRARLTKRGASSAAEPGRAAGMLTGRASGRRQGSPPDGDAALVVFERLLSEAEAPGAPEPTLRAMPREIALVSDFTIR